MNSSLFTAIISIASVVCHVHAEISQHTVKKYENQTPFLSFFAQNRFLSLPSPPTKVTYGRDEVQLNVPAPLDTYLWELIGYFKAETTGEYTFSIGETKAAAIQLGTKNTTSSNFHEIVLGDLNLFSESAAEFSLEKDSYYPIKITYISGSKRVPVFVSVGGEKTELNNEIKQVSYGAIPTESPAENSSSSPISWTGTSPDTQNKVETVNQELAQGPVSSSQGEIDKLVNNIVQSLPPVPDELTNTGIDNRVKDLVEGVPSAGSVTEHALDNLNIDPLFVEKVNPKVAKSARGKSATEKMGGLVVDLSNAPNKGEDVNSNSGDVAKKIQTEQIDEMIGTDDSLEDGKPKVTKEHELSSQITNDNKGKKQDPENKVAPKTGVKAKRGLENIYPEYTNKGFFYTLKIVPQGEDYSALLKNHEKLLVVEVGYFDESYTGNIPTFATPYVVEIIGHAEVPVAGKYNILMNDSMVVSVQIGPGVSEKQAEYTIDNKWAIMDNRIFSHGEAGLQTNLFYPFRIVLLAQTDDFQFEMNTTGPDGKMVDLFGLWQNEAQAQAQALAISPEQKNETFTAPNNELSEAVIPSTPLSTNSSAKFNVSGVLAQPSPTLSVAGQGKNVSDLVSPSQEASTLSSSDLKSSFSFSARFGFSACVAGSICASPVCPNLMLSGTLSVGKTPGKYVVSCNENICLDSSPAPESKSDYKFPTSGPASIDDYSKVSASASPFGPVANEPKGVQPPSHMEDITLDENAPASIKPNSRFSDSTGKDDPADSSLTPQGNSALKEPANDNGKKFNAEEKSLPSTEPKAASPSGHIPGATLYEGSGSKAAAVFSFVPCLALLLLI